MSRKFNIPADEYVVKPKIEEERLEEKKDNTKDKIIYVSRETLICDKENSEIYGADSDESITALAEDIKTNGFKGAIMAYPIAAAGAINSSSEPATGAINSSSEPATGAINYQIESGHRRYLAAVKAGLTEIPVIVTEPPKRESERTIRLISMNLHTRENLKPTITAKIIETLMEANKKEQEIKNAPTDVASLLDITAGQMELSVKSLQKYRQLLKLIPELRMLADSGIAWSALVQCASLPEQKQFDISETIYKEMQKVGAENISRPWIISLATRARQDLIDEPVKTKTVLKRRDGSKIVAKCAKDFDDILRGNAVFKEEDKQTTLENLRRIRECVDKKIEELTK